MLQNNAFCGEFVDGNIRTYLCIHVKCLIYFCPILTKSCCPQQILIKVLIIIFYGNPLKGISADTRRHGQTDRHDEVNWRFSRLMRTRLETQNLSVGGVLSSEIRTRNLQTRMTANYLFAT